MKSKNFKDKLKNSLYKKGKVLKAKANILRAFFKQKKIILKSKSDILRIYFNKEKIRNSFYKKKIIFISKVNNLRFFLKQKKNIFKSKANKLKIYFNQKKSDNSLKIISNYSFSDFKNNILLSEGNLIIANNIKKGFKETLFRTKKSSIFLTNKLRDKSANIILFFKVKIDRYISPETKNDSDLNLLPPPPIWSRIMIWTIGSGSVFVLIWSIFTKVEETVMLQGELTTNRAPVSITTKDQGVLSYILIKPYQEINKGQILLKFKDDETLLRIASLEKRLRYLKSQSEKDDKTYKLKIKQTDEQIKLDKELIDKFYLLSQEGAISKIQYQEKRTELINLLISQESLVEESESSQLRYKEKMEEIQNNIDELVAKSKRFSVRSPIDGYIQQIKYQTEGERIQPGETLITIIPKGELIAKIKIPSNLSAPVKVNYPATLDVDAYPSSDFGMVNAEVSSVSPMSGPANQNSPQRIFTAELKILSTVSPDLLELDDLLPGMAVTARLRLREKPIITTVFDVLSDVFDPLSEKK